MRILHVLTFVDLERRYGGPVTVAYQLAEAQMRHGDSVSVFGLTTKAKKREVDFRSTVETTLFSGWHILGLKKFSTLISVRAMLWLIKNAKNYDVVHLHFSKDIFQVFSALLVKFVKVKYVIQSHGMLTTTPKSRLLENLYRPLLNFAIRHSHSQFALNKVEARDLTARDWFRRGSIIGNGIVFPPNLPESGVPSNRVVFLSRLQSRKNPLLFVEMAKYLVSQKNCDLVFVLAGPDEGEGQAVVKAISELGSNRLSHVGALPHQEARHFISEAALLVLPSVDEPFPMVVLEALSLGVPVVVTDTCHIADLISENCLGLVSQPNPIALSLAVQKVLSQKYPKRDIQIRAKQLFNIDITVDKFNLAYQKRS